MMVSTSGFARALLHATAVVTTFRRSLRGRKTTFSGARRLKDECTSAMPCPHPTKATWDEIERTSWITRGEKPFARQAATRLSIADSSPQWDAIAELEKTLEAGFERELVANAVVATDVAKANRIWELRHNISEANKRAGFTVSNDTSVPVSKLPRFIDLVTERIEQQVAGAAVCHAGHIGDGNIHVIAVLSRSIYGTPEQCEAAATKVNLIVHEASVELGGSISAEHGIGRMHVERLERFKPAIDLNMMRTLKAAFDPMNLMNPGKVLRSRT